MKTTIAVKTDTDLQEDILDELRWEPSVDAAEIGVTVEDGVATLRGFVAGYHEKASAEHAAMRVKGVRGVADDLEVRIPGHGQKTDTDLAKAAIDALTWNIQVPHDHIKVSVRKGWITLEGEVEWQYQRAAAENSVRSLVGVTGITNLITLRPQTPANQIATRIEEALARAANLDAHQIEVESRHGKVVLKGAVRSWAERQEAERAAYAAPGVTHVENLITIAPWGPTD